MENITLTNVHQHKRRSMAAKKKTMKKKKNEKNPIKVVYISNPKKFNTSATEFRALVQELTGLDSDPTKLLDPDYNGHGQLTEDQPPPLDTIAESKIDVDDQVFSWEPTSEAKTPPPPPPPPPVMFDEPLDGYEYDDALMPRHHHQTYENSSSSNNNNISGLLFSDFFSCGFDMLEELINAN